MTRTDHRGGATPSHARQLRTLLEGPEIVVAPGGYDGLSAMLIRQAGFAAMYLSGASLAYTRFGRPDIGLVSMAEVAETVCAIRERIDEFPLVVDADNGYGNALNVRRTVQLFERMGASAIQLEDQSLPKRCGHLPGKSLIATADMAAKLRAATDARRDDDTVIVARTDAVAVEGFDAALERAAAYLEAGADVLFVEAPRTVEQMRAVVAAFGARAPLLANMVEGGQTPLSSASELQALGYRIAIFPGALVRAHAAMATRFLASLKTHGSTQPWRAEMLDFDGLNALLGTRELLELSASYETTRR